MTIRLILDAATEAIVDVFSRATASNSMMRSIKIDGHVVAKKRGCVTPLQCRAILPLPSFAAVIDSALSTQMQQTVQTAADECGTGFLECARCGRQVLDITFPLSQVIEKGADDHCRAAIAQSDIKQFYEFLRPLLIFRWLSERYRSYFSTPTYPAHSQVTCW